jgi:hypothetical protein
VGWQVKIKRQDYDTYEEWREAWGKLMEPVISEENYNKYIALWDADWEAANQFFSDVMDHEAMLRNKITAEKLIGRLSTI